MSWFEIGINSRHVVSFQINTQFSVFISNTKMADIKKQFDCIRILKTTVFINLNKTTPD